MENKPKISVLAPAYQAENFIQRYIDCVLNFDYPNIELILINDGSKDRTHEIIESNRERIIKAGIELKYINLVENKGQAYAVNEGLKEVTGEYLSWHDVDDIFFSNCLTRCYEVIQEHPECKLILNKAEVVNNFDLDKVIGYLPKKNFKHKNLFLNYLIGRNNIYTPVRFAECKALFEVLENKSIDVSRGGQNLQLLLPLVYKYKWFFLDEILSKYVIYESSHSHSINKIEHNKQVLYIKIQTINRMKIAECLKNLYKALTIIKFIFQFINNLFKININRKKKFLKIILFGYEIFNSERIFNAKHT